MNRRDLISMGVRNLVKRKLRTFLTVLGVTIGTAAIVMMISLGLAVNANFDEIIKNAGDMTLITINDYSRYGGMVGAVATEAGQEESVAPKLTDETIAGFEELPGAVVATPILEGNLYFKSGSYYMSAYCMGLKPEAMPLLGYEIEDGRLLQEGDGKTEVVFGRYAEKNFQKLNSSRYEDRFYPAAFQGQETATFVDISRDSIRMSPDSRFIFNEEDPSIALDPDDINAPKPITPYTIDIVGVLKSKEQDWNAMSGVFFEINALKELVQEAEDAQKSAEQEWGYFSAREDSGDDTTYTTAYVKCKDLESTQAVYKIIAEEMGYQAYYPGQQISVMQDTSRMLQLLLAAIGGVSMFVAAIGIANTMVMSIYERTREIGVMKVIGAAIKDIKWLFLLESAMLGFFGGALGLGVSFLFSYIMNTTDVFANLFSGFMPMYMMSGEGGTVVSLITPWLCGVAMGFSSVVGLLSGYFPARRAMKLSALSAIRTE